MPSSLKFRNSTRRSHWASLIQTKVNDCTLNVAIQKSNVLNCVSFHHEILLFSAGRPVFFKQMENFDIWTCTVSGKTINSVDIAMKSSHALEMAW
ncbi:hypothetical protein EMPG_14681 [Blastomyces silverae]|uniref:Uncharacterized protein n=1 Tax=Blastomyces silverae TaxID=2060906 RepID=A0A0H1BFL4_9EURO|nr:hypothetical protein EMPG_14681 [Blastomyces silverae]